MRITRGFAPLLTLIAATALLAGCTSPSSGGQQQGASSGLQTTVSSAVANAPATTPATGTSTAATGGPITVAVGSAAGVSGAASGASPAGQSSSGTVSSGAVPSGQSSTAHSTSIATSSAPTTTTKPTPVPPAASVSSSPAINSTNLSPVQPITVAVAKGTISDISLVSPSGYQVKGALSKDKSSWTTGEVLGYGKTYQLTGAAVGTDGKTVPISGHYTMLKPAKLARTTISPGDGAVVGVAMPVMIQFLTTTPQDRALIEKNVTITTTPKVNGAWAWIDHDGGIWGLDYRPKGYWPAGTKVHVEAKMYGLKFAAGSYGKTDVTSSFTIGRNQVVIANANAHNIVVQRNGHTVATYPASYGAAKDTDTSPGHTATDRQTHSGIHVVNDLKKDLTMTSPLFKYSEKEKWAVRISDNGEFIHANPDTINQQGHANVSHGCINLSLKAAEAYFRSAIVGDPVQVTGTSVKLGPADGDIFDYAINWDTWVGLSGKNG